MDIREKVARAICAACEENPDHKGDCRGNKWRWQDYLPVADAALAAAPQPPSVGAEPVAWMRKWAFDGEEPRKEKRDNGRLAWPFKFKLLPVSQTQCLPDDVPLVPTQKGGA